MKRINGFDGLRAIAVSLVIISHQFPDIPAALGLTRPQIGNLGVFVFFILSGFLITRILLRNEHESPARLLSSFYARRTLRIFPIYYLTIVVAALSGVHIMQNMLVWNFFYSSNLYIFLHGKWVGCASHLWSLSLEEQFYLVWPAVLLITPRRHLTSVLVGLCILSPLSRWLLLENKFHVMVVKAFPTTTMEFLSIGCILAILDDNNRLVSWFRYHKIVALLSMIAIAAHYFFTPPSESVVAGWSQYCFLLFPLSWLVIFVFLNQESLLTRALSSRPIDQIGKLSYGIYLYHNFTPLILGSFVNSMGWNFPAGPWFSIVAQILTLVLAFVSYKLIEKPLLNLKTVFKYRDTKASGGEFTQKSST